MPYVVAERCNLWGVMRLGGEPVGRWGIALMAVTAVAGVALAVHGWSARAAKVAPTLASGSHPAASSPAPRPPASASPAPPASAAPAGPGPRLSSEPYASAAFQIWPGPASTAARQALSGLKVTVRKRGSALSVTAAVNGQPAGAQHTYPGGARVYVVEASLGDDSGNADYSLGDDGLVVTDSQGRILQ